MDGIIIIIVKFVKGIIITLAVPASVNLANGEPYPIFQTLNYLH